jgi:chemotaxis family two-component system sensor kinase Cph1
MLLELAQIAGGWPFAASLAAVATARTLREGRRRTALNEAIHELRRPFQALALAAPSAGAAEPSRLDQSLHLAAAALERLEQQINGEPAVPARRPVRAAPLLEAAVERWQGRAALSGGSIRLRWHAADAVLSGDRCEIAQAVDNLIVNAIEHGGPRIEIAATLGVGWLRIVISDSGDRPSSGRKPSRSARRDDQPGMTGRLSGRRRHGHGLRVVNRTVAAHGGDFRLRRSDRGTEAVLELPLLAGEVAA